MIDEKYSKAPASNDCSIQAKLKDNLNNYGVELLLKMDYTSLMKTIKQRARTRQSLNKVRA